MFWNSLREECRPTGVAYASFDIMIATLLQFSLATYLLNPESPHHRNNNSSRNQRKKHHSSSLELRSSDDGMHINSSTGAEEEEGLGLLGVQDRKQQQQQQHEDIELIPVAHYGHTTTNIGENHHHHHHHHSTAPATTTTTITSIDWYGFFPLPTQASIAGIIVGCTAPVKSFFMGTLAPVYQTLTVLGDAAVPLSVPLLGAVIYRGPGKSELSWKIMIGVIVIRLIIQPALMTGLVMGMLKSGVLPELDELAVMMMLLAHAVPTAINMSTFVVLYNHGVQEMSAILFYQYMCALITLPGWMWVFLRILR